MIRKIDDRDYATIVGVMALGAMGAQRIRRNFDSLNAEAAQETKTLPDNSSSAR